MVYKRQVKRKWVPFLFLLFNCKVSQVKITNLWQFIQTPKYLISFWIKRFTLITLFAYKAVTIKWTSCDKIEMQLYNFSELFSSNELKILFLTFDKCSLIWGIIRVIAHGRRIWNSMRPPLIAVNEPNGTLQCDRTTSHPSRTRKDPKRKSTALGRQTRFKMLLLRQPSKRRNGLFLFFFVFVALWEAI